MSAKCLPLAGNVLQKVVLWRVTGASIPLASSIRGASCLPLNYQTLKKNATFDNGNSCACLVVNHGCLEQRRYKRRQPIVYTKQLNFDYSGDLEKILPPEPKAYVYKYQDLPELENAPEAVRKLVSLEFADRATRRKHRQHEVFKNIEEKLDGELGRERLIALWTMQIRNQMTHCLVYRGDKVGKSRLIEKIAKRKKYLKFLRSMDFERFYWLLYELRIRYTNFPHYYNKLTKRYLRKQAVRRKARALWVAKMEEFKKSIEGEKGRFYEEKEKIMAHINRDLQDLHVDEKQVFNDFVKSLEPPKRIPMNKNYQRILKNYEDALASGKVVPKPQMSPVR